MRTRPGDGSAGMDRAGAALHGSHRAQFVGRGGRHGPFG